MAGKDGPLPSTGSCYRSGSDWIPAHSKLSLRFDPYPVRRRSKWGNLLEELLPLAPAGGRQVGALAGDPRIQRAAPGSVERLHPLDEDLKGRGDAPCQHVVARLEMNPWKEKRIKT